MSKSAEQNLSSIDKHELNAYCIICTGVTTGKEINEVPILKELIFFINSELYNSSSCVEG